MDLVFPTLEKLQPVQISGWISWWLILRRVQPLYLFTFASDFGRPHSKVSAFIAGSHHDKPFCLQLPPDCQSSRPLAVKLRKHNVHP